ncbi:MAG TPA: tRNA glutamyl-Q(34) synthetase GluQRS [Roseiarcus sp.]|nr:tRNA glutamyl-Q(34) synthetase GluQRS [Roseiarcus sp.]
MPVLRFAPTPNGLLHLGHAYSALRNAELAARLGAKLLLRFEDTDPSRCRPEYEVAVVDALAWLGVACEPNPRRQSEHASDYAHAFDVLRRRGLVYPCYCTRGQIAATKAGRDPDGAALHRGGCVAVSAEATQARLARGEAANWRLDLARALAQAPPLAWAEYFEGDAPAVVAAEPQLWGDILVAARDRPAVYHLAVVVDDALQGVTDVARGRDLFASTSLHRLLQTLLDLPAPRYRHHRLVLDAAGAKLSKSAKSTSLAALRAGGVSAAQVRAALGFGDGEPPFAVAFS